jgi:hypothetical protein
MRYLLTKLSQAHCLVAHAITQPKPAKELALPTRGQTKIKHETLTNRNKNAGCSKSVTVRPASGFSTGDTDATPQSRTFATVDRCAQ